MPLQEHEPAGHETILFMHCQGRCTRRAGQRFRAEPRRGARDLATSPITQRAPGLNPNWNHCPDFANQAASWPGGGDPGRWAFSGRQDSGSDLRAGSARARCGGGRLSRAADAPTAGARVGEGRRAPGPAGTDRAKLVGPHLPERVARPTRTGKLAGNGGVSLSPSRLLRIESNGKAGHPGRRPGREMKSFCSGDSGSVGGGRGDDK